MEYFLKFNMPYITCDNYKEKELLNFIGIVNGSRVGLLLNGYSYANIRFSEEDKKHENPIITELDSFSRSKTNCIIFNIENNKYDKIFIYQTLNKENPYYGILAFSTETQKLTHIYNIEYDHSKLIIYMFRMLSNK